MFERKEELIRLKRLHSFKSDKNYVFSKREKKLFNNIKLFFPIKKLQLVIELSFLFLLLNMKKIKEAHDIISRDDIRFITCFLGAKKIRRNHRIRKYFQALDHYVPYANVIFCVSEYTKIDPIIIRHKNITIKIKRFRNKVVEKIRNKYPHSSRFFYNGIRYYFYSKYLKKNSKIKYVVISDDDTLFFRDPFPLIYKDPNVVHFMEDIYPFSVTKDGNYIWLNAWDCLDNKIKKKCRFKHLNKTILSDEYKNKIPLNSGLMMGSSKNII